MKDQTNKGTAAESDQLFNRIGLSVPFRLIRQRRLHFWPAQIPRRSESYMCVCESASVGVRSFQEYSWPLQWDEHDKWAKKQIAFHLVSSGDVSEQEIMNTTTKK